MFYNNGILPLLSGDFKMSIEVNDMLSLLQKNQDKKKYH